MKTVEILKELGEVLSTKRVTSNSDLTKCMLYPRINVLNSHAISTHFNKLNHTLRIFSNESSTGNIKVSISREQDCFNRYKVIKDSSGEPSFDETFPIPANVNPPFNIDIDFFDNISFPNDNQSPVIPNDDEITGPPTGRGTVTVGLGTGKLDQ